MKKDIKRSVLVLPVLMLLISGLLRFHAWAFTEAIFGLFIFSFQWKKIIGYAVLKGGLLIAIVLLYFVHHSYYKNKIAGWEQKETRSQILFGYYNSPRSEKKYQGVFNDSIEANFFYSGFFYDSLMFTDARLKEIISQLRRVRGFSYSIDRQTIYWSFMNGRFYFYILVISLFYFFFEKKRNVLKRSLPFLLVSILLYAYLFIFKKVTDPMFMGFLIMNWLVLFVFSAANDPVFHLSKTRLIFIPLLIFSFVWGTVRIYKINSANIEKYSKWLCYYNDLKKNSSVIHIASNPDFPIDYCSITDNPKNYEVNNFISGSQFPKTVFEKKLQEYGLKNVLENVLRRTDLSFIGPEFSSLKEYYLKKYNKEIVLVEDKIQYKCSNVYKVISK